MNGINSCEAVNDMIKNSKLHKAMEDDIRMRGLPEGFLLYRAVEVKDDRVKIKCGFCQSIIDMPLSDIENIDEIVKSKHVVCPECNSPRSIVGANFIKKIYNNKEDEVFKEEEDLQEDDSDNEEIFSENNDVFNMEENSELFPDMNSLMENNEVTEDDIEGANRKLEEESANLEESENEILAELLVNAGRDEEEEDPFDEDSHEMEEVHDVEILQNAETVPELEGFSTEHIMNELDELIEESKREKNDIEYTESEEEIEVGEVLDEEVSLNDATQEEISEEVEAADIKEDEVSNKEKFLENLFDDENDTIENNDEIDIDEALEEFTIRQSARLMGVPEEKYGSIYSDFVYYQCEINRVSGGPREVYDKYSDRFFCPIRFTDRVSIGDGKCKLVLSVVCPSCGSRHSMKIITQEEKLQKDMKQSLIDIEKRFEKNFIRKTPAGRDILKCCENNIKQISKKKNASFLVSSVIPKHERDEEIVEYNSVLLDYWLAHTFTAGLEMRIKNNLLYPCSVFDIVDKESRVLKCRSTVLDTIIVANANEDLNECEVEDIDDLFVRIQRDANGKVLNEKEFKRICSDSQIPVARMRDIIVVEEIFINDNDDEEPIISSEDDLKSQGKLDILAKNVFSLMMGREIDYIPEDFHFEYEGNGKVKYRCPYCVGVHYFHFPLNEIEEFSDFGKLYSHVIGEDYANIMSLPTNKNNIAMLDNISADKGMAKTVKLNNVPDAKCEAKRDYGFVRSKLEVLRNRFARAKIYLPKKLPSDVDIFSTLVVQVKTKSGETKRVRITVERLLKKGISLYRNSEEGVQKRLKKGLNGIPEDNEDEIHQAYLELSGEEKEIYDMIRRRSHDISFFSDKRDGSESTSVIGTSDFLDEEQSYKLNRFKEEDFYKKVIKNIRSQMNAELFASVIGKKQSIIFDMYVEEQNTVYRYLLLETENRNHIDHDHSNVKRFNELHDLKKRPYLNQSRVLDDDAKCELGVIYKDSFNCLSALEARICKQVGLGKKLQPKHRVHLANSKYPLIYTVADANSQTVNNFRSEHSHHLGAYARAASKMLYIVVPVPKNREFEDNAKYAPELKIDDVYDGYTQMQRASQSKGGILDSANLYMVCGILYYIESSSTTTTPDKMGDQRAIITEYIESGITQIVDGLSFCIAALIRHMRENEIIGARNDINILLEEDHTDLFHEDSRKEISKIFHPFRNTVYTQNLFKQACLPLYTNFLVYRNRYNTVQRYDQRYLSDQERIAARFPADWEEFLHSKNIDSPHMVNREIINQFLYGHMQMMPVVSNMKNHYSIKHDSLMHLHNLSRLMTPRPEMQSLNALEMDNNAMISAVVARSMRQRFMPDEVKQ